MTVPTSRTFTAATVGLLLGLVIGAAYFRDSTGPPGSPTPPDSTPGPIPAERAIPPATEPEPPPSADAMASTPTSRLQERVADLERQSSRKNEALRDARYEVEKLADKVALLENELNWIRSGDEQRYRDEFPNDEIDSVRYLRRDIFRLYGDRLSLTPMEIHRLLGPCERYRSGMREARDSPDRERTIQEITRDLLHGARAALPADKFEVFRSFYE